MIESAAYEIKKEGFEEGRQQGIEQGIQQGKLEGFLEAVTTPRPKGRGFYPTP